VWEGVSCLVAKGVPGFLDGILPGLLLCRVFFGRRDERHDSCSLGEFQKGPNQNTWVFGGASPIFGIDMEMNSGDDVAWLDDASMEV